MYTYIKGFPPVLPMMQSTMLHAVVIYHIKSRLTYSWSRSNKTISPVTQYYDFQSASLTTHSIAYHIRHSLHVVHISVPDIQKYTGRYVSLHSRLYMYQHKNDGNKLYCPKWATKLDHKNWQNKP